MIVVISKDSLKMKCRLYGKELLALQSDGLGVPIWYMVTESSLTSNNPPGSAV